MDFMPLRLNSFSLTCSICAMAAIILQLVAMECQKLHMVDSPIVFKYGKTFHLQHLHYAREPQMIRVRNEYLNLLV